MKIVTALLSCLALFAVLGMVSPVYAQTIGFDPSSGTFTNDFTIDVALDTDVESIAGVSIEVQYDETKVSYTGYTDGDIPCDPLTVANNSSTGTITIDCLMDLAAPTNGSFTGSGSLVQLQFNPIADGALPLTITVTDDGGVTFTTSAGGYTIASTGTLPDTNVLLNSIILAGLGLIVVGFVWIRYGERWMRTIGGISWFEGRLGSRI